MVDPAVKVVVLTADAGANQRAEKALHVGEGEAAPGQLVLVGAGGTVVVEYGF